MIWCESRPPRASSRRCEALERRRLLSAGDPDPSFGDGGWVAVHDPAFVVPVASSANAVAFQPDGKVVVAGTANERLALARYNPDGSLDPAFDGDGIAMPTGEIAGGEVRAIAVQGDGSIVLAGMRAQRFFFARLRPDGSPDPGFDSDGSVTILNYGEGPVRSLVVQPDGKILGAGGEQDSLLVRLNPDGSLDRTFDGDGLIGGDLSGGVFTNYADYFTSVALGPGGSILLAGATRVDRFEGRSTFSVLRPDGSAVGGAVLDRPSGVELYNALTTLPDGRFLAAAARDSSLVLARFNADGTPDTTFGDAGRVRKSGGFEWGNVGHLYAARFMPDGRLVAVGEGSTFDGPRDQLGVLRFNPDGTLDTSFGGQGWVKTDVADAYDRGVDVAISPAGEIAAAAYGGFDIFEGGLSRFIAARYRADGQPESAFGTGGVVKTLFIIPTPVTVTAVGPAPGGKVVSAGTVETGGQVYVERRNADGTLDPTFGGGDGWEFLDIGSAQPAAVLARPDGSVLVSGTLFGTYLMLLRLNPDGTPDAMFGGGDGVGTAYGRYASAGDLAALPDGRVVVGGGVTTAQGVERFGLARFLPDGELDPSFGTAGTVMTHVSPGDATAGGVALAPDGGIVLAGFVREDHGSFFISLPTVLRYLPDGTPDPSFGASGQVVNNFVGGRGARLTDVLVQPDGKIVATGTFLPASGEPAGVSVEIGVARYLPDGSLDPSFDGDGWRIVDVGRPNAQGLRVARQPDGKLVVAGSGSDGVQQGVVLARLLEDGSLDPSFGDDGTAIVTYRGAYPSPRDITLALDGRILLTGLTPGGSVIGRFFGDAMTPPPATVVARHVFYNGSTHDGGDAAANAGDDGAIATDKEALLPGAAAAFANVTSYTRGLNGVMVDVAGLPEGAGPGPADFAVRSARAGNPLEWSAGPAPAVVTVRRGEGKDGSDRVTLTWPDFDPRSAATGLAVGNGWLEVTMLPGGRTGLALGHAFAFGNLIGETGDAATVLRVSALDLAATKRAMNSSNLPPTAPADFNRDGRVNALDLAAARGALSKALATPVLPVSAPAAMSVQRVWWDEDPIAF